MEFFPKTSITKTKHLSIIDTSQAKDSEMWQFTFKSKTIEEKKEWQTSILTCILNNYGNNRQQKKKNAKQSSQSTKINSPIHNLTNITFKQPHNKLNSSDDTSTSSSIAVSEENTQLNSTMNNSGMPTMRRPSSNYLLLKNKMPNFKKLIMMGSSSSDFKNSLKLKNEYKSCDKLHDLNLDSLIADKNCLNNSNMDMSRRLSSPIVQHTSRFAKLLDKTINFSNNTPAPPPPQTPSLLLKTSNNSGQKEEQLMGKLFSKFRSSSSNSADLKENKRLKHDVVNTTPTKAVEVETDLTKKEAPMIIETIRKDINALFDTLNISLEELSGNLAADKPHDITNEPTSTEFADILNKIDDFCGGNRSSKSSINSEEGYFSNQDSSCISATIQPEIEQKKSERLPKTPIKSGKETSIGGLNSNRTIYTPELFKEMEISLENLTISNEKSPESQGVKTPLYNKKKVAAVVACQQFKTSPTTTNTKEANRSVDNSSYIITDPKKLGFYSQYSPRQLLKNTSLSKIKYFHTKFSENFSNYNSTFGTLNRNNKQKNEQNSNKYSTICRSNALSKSKTNSTTSLSYSFKREIISSSDDSSTCSNSVSRTATPFSLFAGAKRGARQHRSQADILNLDHDHDASSDEDGEFLDHEAQASSENNEEDYDNEDDSININVKNLITKFENRKLIFNGLNN